MDTVQRALLHFAPSAADLLRTCVWFCLLAIVFVPLERIFGLHPQKVLRKAVLVDVAYYFLNSLLPTALIAVPMSVIAWSLRHVLLGFISTWAAVMPLWIRLGLGLLVGEFGYYWGHRFSHEIPWLWRFHSVHHSAEEMDWLVSSRGHPFDVAFGRLCGIVPMYALGLVVPKNGQPVDPVALTVTLIGMMWGYLIHANVRWRWEWLAQLLSTPAFHHWHHTSDGHINRNYASMLPIWDRLFGTWFLPKNQWPATYGIDKPMSANLAVQLMQPFDPEEEPTSLPSEGSPIVSGS